MATQLPALPLHPASHTLALIKAEQQRRWATLDIKPVWSQSDFEEALFCHNDYIVEKGEWFYSEEAIKKLAFDARTPDDMARKLQAVATQMAR